MLRRERRRGGRGDRVKEAAASGWRHRRWLHWHRRRETLQFLLSFFSLISAVRDSFSSDPLLLLPLLFCRGGPARGNLRFRKNSLPSGSGHGEKVFWGGCGAAAGKCGTKIPGVGPVCHMNVTRAGKTCR